MSTLALAVRKAAAADLSQVNKALSAAFYDDPVFRWITPDDDRRQRTTSRYLTRSSRRCSRTTQIYTTDPAGTGAALWSLPDTRRWPRTTPKKFGNRLEAIAGEDAGRLFELVELMEAAHPHEPHNYLWFIAVRTGDAEPGRRVRVDGAGACSERRRGHSRLSRSDVSAERRSTCATASR